MTVQWWLNQGLKLFESLLHGGPIGCKKLQPRNYFCIFYSFELKLCRMVELCIPKNPMFFCFLILMVLVGKWCHKIAAKLKFQDMAKQINNFKKARRDRIECEIFFSKTQLVKESLNFDFWISRHSVTIFRNISTFRDAISPKANELCPKFFHICFYHLKLFQNYLFVLL